MCDAVELAKRLITSRFDLTSEEAGRMLERMSEHQHVSVETVAAELVAAHQKRGEPVTVVAVTDPPPLD
jgi:hypothetical protein